MSNEKAREKESVRERENVRKKNERKRERKKEKKKERPRALRTSGGRVRAEKTGVRNEEQHEPVEKRILSTPCPPLAPSSPPSKPDFKAACRNCSDV
ncbi:hypothetical protein PUN28_018753 [Cardiocondyla obscurior]|uniref:Uncharacterized protein n=1 Tax=Cardiocondyla obscurior TaxID=286306 RepID=A0AAW2EFP6_9HYME